jgi:PII-like signaling protein
MTEPRKAVQVTVYLNEADEWHHRPLHMEMLKYLREQEVAGATVLHAVAGFTGHSRVKTATLVDAGGKLPLVVTFIDMEEHVERVLPHIREMAPHRLIVSEKVTLESGELE